jgi:hypothetical protein
MTSLASMTAGLQAISSWVMAVLAILATLVSVIIGILFVEFIVERDSFSRAYTVKTNLFDGELQSTRDRMDL